MIRTFSDNGNLGFKWIDILQPSAEELHAIAKEYGIHEAFINDALQPEHLPKYEPLDKTSFFILRYYAPDEKEEADTIQELTDKVAIFMNDTLVITIHKYDAPFIDDLKKELIDSRQCRGTFHLLNRLTKAVFQSYETPALELAKRIDYYETKTFLKKNPPPILKGLYHVKRKIEVSRRLLILSRDILERIDDPAHRDPDTSDTRDLYVRMLTLFDSMSENANQLLTIYFSISSHRINEIIRVLTIFSVFFMPLTFIVGVYGMNFDFMPELHWRSGYPLVMLFMGIVVVAIYIWFKRKGWL